MFIFALVLGIVLLPISIWMYRGRTPKSRFWLNQDGFIDERGVVLLFPGLTAVFLGMGTSQLWSLLLSREKLPALLYTLTGISFIVAFAGFVLFMWGVLNIRYPEKMRPKYLRDLEAAGRYDRNAPDGKRLLTEEEARRRNKREERQAKKSQKRANPLEGKYGEKASDKKADKKSDKASDKTSGKEK